MLEIKIKLDYKVELRELVKINKRLDSMPTNIEVRKMREDTIELISDFREDNKNFKTAFNQHDEILKRYDEILCQKASLMRVEEMRLNIEQKYDP